MAKKGIHIKASHKGLLHKNLGVKQGEKIPASKLSIKSTDSTAVKRRKNFAIQAKKWHHGQDGLNMENSNPYNWYNPQGNNVGIPPLSFKDLQGNVNFPTPPGSTVPDIKPYQFIHNQAPKPKTAKSQDFKKTMNDIGTGALIGLTALDAILPQDRVQPPVVRPSLTFNQYPYGTGSQAIAQDGAKLPPPSKASIDSSRKAAVIGLIKQGVVKESELLNYLNYDNLGNPTGDFTKQEIRKYYPTNVKIDTTNNPIPIKPIIKKKINRNADSGITLSTEGYKKYSKDKNKNKLRIPSNKITMKDVPHDVLGIDNQGNMQHMTPGNDYEFPGDYVDEYPMAKDGKWLQGAVNPKHKGYCTPMTKSTCTPRRKAFAMTMKKHHGFHKGDDGLMLNVQDTLFPPSKNGSTLSAGKAAEMLKDGTAHKHPLTAKQKHYFQAVAHGWKPSGEAGMEIKYWPFYSMGGAIDLRNPIDYSPIQAKDVSSPVYLPGGQISLADFIKEHPQNTKNSSVKQLFGFNYRENGGNLYAEGGGLSRKEDYGSKSHPYPSVASGDFAGSHRSYPIPTKCLSGDTEILSLDGKSYKIRDIVGKEIWVYSFDMLSKAIVPAKATNIHKTIEDSEVYQVTLDNGESIICTGNHPFLNRDGEYVLAENLEGGSSLMPIYTELENMGNGDLYEMVYQPFYGFWEYTHKLSWRGFNNKHIPYKYHIHHVDGNRFNNTPYNLQCIDQYEHARIHSREIDKVGDVPLSVLRWSKDNAREEASRRMKIENQLRHKSGQMKEIGRKISENKKQWHWSKIKYDIDKYYEMYLAGKSLSELAEMWGVSEGKVVKQRFLRAGYSIEKPSLYNHKVVSVIKLDSREDVYDLTVDKYHNFAISAGVFVHNSDAVDALRLAGLHHRSDVKAKVYAKYPDLKKGENGLEMLDGNTVEFQGPSHEDGGIPIQYGGKGAEVEGDETGYLSPIDNSLTIMGNMKNPLTGRKFKSDSKILADKESKMDSLLSDGFEMVDKNNPYDTWENLKFNAGRVMMSGAAQKKQELLSSKEHLKALQKAMLDYSHENNLDPQEFSKGNLKKAKNGMSLPCLDCGGKMQDGSEPLHPNHGFNRKPRGASLKDWEYHQNDGLWYRKQPTTTVTTPSTTPVVNKMSLAQRHNNPGNLMYSDWEQEYGAEKGDARYDKKGKLIGYFAKFPSLQRGQDAMKNLLTGKNYRDLTVSQASSKWTGEGSYKNIPDSIRNKKIGDLSDDELNLALDTFTLGEDSKKYNWEGTGKQAPNLQVPYEAPTVNWQNINTPAVTPPQKPATLPDYNFNFKNPENYALPSDAQGLELEQVLPEIYAVATNHVQPVHLQQYNPQLFQPYNVSFQDQRNENQATFSALSKATRTNPSALSTLAGQKYSADSQSLANEFRTNQGIYSDVVNKNVNLLNDAQLKNLQLADTQYTRQEQAKSNTRAINHDILNSISAKMLQNEANNRKLQTYENLYDFRYDPEMRIQYLGPSGADYIAWTGGAGNEGGMSGAQSSSQRYDKAGNLLGTTVTTPSANKQWLEEANMKNKYFNQLPISRTLNRNKKGNRTSLADVMAQYP